MQAWMPRANGLLLALLVPGRDLPRAHLVRQRPGWWSRWRWRTFSSSQPRFRHYSFALRSDHPRAPRSRAAWPPRARLRPRSRVQRPRRQPRAWPSPPRDVIWPDPAPCATPYFGIALSQPPLEGSALPRPFPRSARARAVSALRAPPDRRSPVRGCAVVVQHDGPARFGSRHDAMVPHGEDGDECERAAGVPRGWAERARLERDDRSVEGASANSAPPTRFFPFRALAACILRDRTASAHRRSNPDAANASECEFMVD